MGLLKKPKKKKPLRTTGGAAATQASSLRPRQVKKAAPCGFNCPSGTKVREWIQIIAQREKTKLSEAEAFRRAWSLLVETNPFPSVMGRVCPHPCEDDCNRADKDAAVSINALERFIGDWGLQQGLPLSGIEGEDRKEESIGVIGSGPAGLSFAYQLARRGYPVTVYEKTGQAGGMLYWGIPFYRLPADVLDKEIRRIVDLGVDLKLNTCVGKDISVDEIKKKHKILFLGVGAHQGRLLKIPGEEGPKVWTGTEYLYRVNAGENVDVGKNVAEIEDALKEGVEIQFLVAPVAMKRDGDRVLAVVVQKMELGEPDDSGRRRPVPIAGSRYEIPIDSLIAAISQEPDWNPLTGLGPEGRWLEADERGKVKDCIYSGGDALNLGLATIAVGQGRQAALAVHAELRGLALPSLKPPLSLVDKKRIKLDVVDVYSEKPRAERAHRHVEEWLSKPDEEIDLGITQEQFLEETARCFSCGNCFGCERCWMFCTPGCFKKVDGPGPGSYYTIKLDTCDGCKKCEDECPCGFIDML
jgi:NADPH-dependent glutamate synthase beta subunit-like oxidoreductase/Pyruvate/2-oxoacid:ferredoxin oxidoreductase delta subunit